MQFKAKRILNGLLRAAIAIFLAFLFCAPAAAEKIPFRSYTTAEGLAHDRVNRIVRDSRGFLWFCTSEGLSRFDGYEFKNYRQDEGLPHRSVVDFLETRNGNLWLATGDGIVLFNPAGSAQNSTGGQVESDAQKMFRVFRDKDLKADTQQSWTVFDLLEDRHGTIWAATEQGLYRLDSAAGDWRLQRVDTNDWGPLSTDFIQLLEDRTGALWIGAGKGLYRVLPGGNVQKVDAELRVEALLEDRAGRIWVGSGGGESRGLYQFVVAENNQPQLARTFDSRDGLTGDHWMNELLETTDGRIFIAVGNGLNEYTPSNDPGAPQFRTLLNEGLVSLGEDASGNLWLGTVSSGALRLARRGFVTYDEADGLKSRLTASILRGAGGELYVIAGEFHRFDGNRFVSAAPLGIVPTNWSTNQISFQDRAGEWWITGNVGLQRYPAVKNLEDLARTPHKKIYTTAEGLFVNAIFQLFEDSRGDIWISTIGHESDSVHRWERATDTIHRYTTADGLPFQNCPTAFGEDSAGNVWMGFYNGGLVRYRQGKFENFTAARDLRAGQVRDFHADRGGRVWIATSSGGVVRIDEPDAENPGLISLTTAEGMASNQAGCVTEDNFGRIYVGTGRGVNRIEPGSGRIKLFTKSDGLPENYIRLCERDAEGALWFASLKGIARYAPQQDEQTTAPPIFLSDLRANGVSVKKLSELGETGLGALELASDQRQIQIEFFALGFGTGETLRYQYKLEGIDADWSEPTVQRTVNLGLSPGAYNFLVRAVNSDGAASASPARVAFTIARPIWQRWWFLVLIGLAAGGIVYALYSYRLRRLLELEKVRTRIATDLHDDIGASLSKIAILSEVVRQRVSPLAPEDAEISEPLEHIAGTSREMVDSMSDIVWAINPHKDRLSDLIQRMRSLAGEMTELCDIRLQVRLIGFEDRDLSLGADLRREIYLIFKETLNNLVKHSACRLAEIEFRLEENTLVITVRDDGKGFDVSNGNGNGTGRGGNGLPNMKRRASNLSGSYEITSQTGAGTTAVLMVPLFGGLRRINFGKLWSKK
ncbi:MAG TPA: two-component regulator propeller domain-containing protein [Pyrinomonadaceae bacterium]